MGKAIITLSLLCVGVLGAINIGEKVFAQDLKVYIGKTNNL